MKKMIKIGAWAIAIVAIVSLALMLICNLIVVKKSQTTIYSFLGKSITINNSLYKQIASIAEQDNMLSYNDRIIQIGDVRWGINLMPNGIALLTSVQPDAPEMKQVIEYLNSIYGEPYDGEDVYSMKWCTPYDTLNTYNTPGCTLVHLRRVHTEEGGTFLFFQ